MGRHAHVAGAKKKRMSTIARMVACISTRKGQCLRPARAAYRVFTKKWNYTKFRVTEQGDAAKPKGLLARMPDTLE
jgi:hypothetical protein